MVCCLCQDNDHYRKKFEVGFVQFNFCYDRIDNSLRFSDIHISKIIKLIWYHRDKLDYILKMCVFYGKNSFTYRDGLTMYCKTAIMIYSLQLGINFNFWLRRHKTHLKVHFVSCVSRSVLWWSQKNVSEKNTDN